MLEAALDTALRSAHGPEAPPGLAAAMRHAVFPGGARIRPRLCLAVARACGGHESTLAMATAAALELLHCASLVHDDLPCFDDAPTRRGQPSVHRAYGERLAVLAGDALIVLAYQTLAQGAVGAPQRLGALVCTLARGTGMPDGIAAGQAWECEPAVVLAAYQRAKTGALFRAAAMAGALAAGAEAAPWSDFGEALGEAYQVADDIRDVRADARWLGKPTGRDRALGRPSSARESGVDAAIEHFDHLIGRAGAALPPCGGADALRALLRHESERLVPKAWSCVAAESIGA